jgi:hypothetical protein
MAPLIALIETPAIKSGCDARAILVPATTASAERPGLGMIL